MDHKCSREIGQRPGGTGRADAVMDRIKLIFVVPPGSGVIDTSENRNHRTDIGVIAKISQFYVFTGGGGGGFRHLVRLFPSGFPSHRIEKRRAETRPTRRRRIGRWPASLFQSPGIRASSGFVRCVAWLSGRGGTQTEVCNKPILSKQRVKMHGNSELELELQLAHPASLPGLKQLSPISNIVCVVFVVAGARAERAERAESSEESESWETRSSRQDKRGIGPQYSPYQSPPNKASSYAHFAAAHQPLRPAPGQGHPAQYQSRPAPRSAIISLTGAGRERVQRWLRAPAAAPTRATGERADRLPGLPSCTERSLIRAPTLPAILPQQKPKVHPQKKRPIQAPESFLPPSAFAHFPPGFQNPVQTDSYFNYDENEDS
ncbi:unnamed protein product [Bemisia tabaci]|uniref:Uncharacterized protein n=1 Tax=Bemisia tabaci TaxID=7038 RepID=A0A9P0F3V2_BEMTA|nr:unnamed protein product [Bemisia tabaci]